MQVASYIRLSRRQRQIMDVLYRRGIATAAEVRMGLPDAPSYSAVRAMLRILEDRGQIRHTERGGRYVYTPVRSRAHAGRTAMQRVLVTFFDNAPEKALAALLNVADVQLSDAEARRLALMLHRPAEKR
jgi:predicted transcriptional regulator